MSSTRVTVVLCAAGLLSLGGLGWLLREIASPLAGGSQPSLLELLEEVRQPPAAPPPGRRAVPAPPSHPQWRSPLHRRCAAVDPQRRQRLQGLLAQINSPADLHGLDDDQLQEVAEEMRRYIIDVIGEIGGHFGANLGTCELAVAQIGRAHV